MAYQLMRWMALNWLVFLAGLVAMAHVTAFSSEKPAAGNDQTQARIVAMQVIPNGDVTCFDVISIGQLADDVYKTQNPARIVIDAQGAVFDLKRQPQKAAGEMVAAYRFGVLRSGMARIVLDASAGTEISDVSRSVIGSDGFRLSVELKRGKKATQSRCRSEATRKLTAKWAKDLTVKSASKTGSGLPVVVIDPGHGGVDPGAVVNKVHLEKVVVLAVARRLAKILRKRGGLKVVLTRNDDTFISLDQRIERSRAHGARLFISLHADSIDEPGGVSTASGAAVYTLSSKASDAEARRFAEKENAADMPAGILPKLAGDEMPIRDILVDLLKRETERESARFGDLLIAAMRDQIRLSKRPRRSAAFHVLKQTETPGVLIELGYMTNPRDLRLLRQEQWQQRMAAAIAKGVEQYFKSK